MNNSAENNNPAIKKIYKAATELYLANGKISFPTVAQVRAAAKTDMNTTSEAMKQWRSQQEQKAQAAPVQVPETVQRAASEAVASIWQVAQSLANDALQTAQKGWEKDKTETDQITKEIAEEFDRQAIQLESALCDNEKLTNELSELKAEHSCAISKITGLEARLQAVEQHNQELYKHLASQSQPSNEPT
ncbi:hypothetical protein D3C78_307940 [compost metagenome]